jgi:dienelactone hydrolase
LEYFDPAIAFLRAQPSVDSASIALFGTSKGAEAALLVAAQNASVRAVVAYAPSSVAWSCICSQSEHSSWSRGGAPVPYVPPGSDPTVPTVPGQPLRPVVNYRYRLRDSSAAARAAIQVEHIRGPVMIIAGDADALWPSGDMARQLRARLAHAPREPANAILIYPDAGHLIGKAYLPAGSTRVAGGRIETGGTPLANSMAQADAWPRVLMFLSAALIRR